MKPLRHFGCWLFLLVGSWLPTFAAEPELHARAGLPNLATKIAHGDELRVAYLGGSITAADGWRSLATAYLQQHYSRLKVTEIAAGLPGTGSNLGACRIGYDVLRHHPDILFVEFAVNDNGAPPELIERTMEGIVRQAKRANPAIDLWFVYTVSQPALADLQAGHFQRSAQAMERVADHYGIPSLHFGIDVGARVSAQQLLFKPLVAAAGGAGAPDSAIPVFSLDGIHPTKAGHQLYFAAIERSLPILLQPTTASHASDPALPAPLHADNWEFATVQHVPDLTHKGEWAEVSADDANLRGVTKALLPPTWRTGQPGASVEFEFTGKKFGLLGIAAPNTGPFRVTVDELPSVTDTLFDSFVTPTFCRQREWFFPNELADGLHHVRIELVAPNAKKPDGKVDGGQTATESSPFTLDHLTLCGALVVSSHAP